MNEEMIREIKLNRNYDINLIIKDDIKELVDGGIDLLIVSPNEAEPLTPIVEEVYDRGIPVIIIDRKINSNKFTSYIGTDNYIIGREAGNYAVELLKGKGKIVEITGLKGSTPAIERANGFHEAIADYPGIQIVKSIEGDWLVEKSLHLTDSLFHSFRDFDLIYAHNDPMAYGAYLSADKYKITPFIIGIDGLNKQNGGVQYVLDGLLNATFLYSTGGDKAIQLALSILNNEPFPKYDYMNTVKIDKSNARIMRLQGEKIQEQQNKIDSQYESLNQMSSLIQKKNTFLLLTSSVIILIVLLAGLIFYTLLHKNRLNKQLDGKHKIISNQNKTITKQRDDLVKMLKITEETKERKLQILTNIYHEFRNVLTLLTPPLKELMDYSFDENCKEQITTVNKASNRLLQLSEEILGYTKLDKIGYKLVFISTDLGQIISGIVDVFKHNTNEKGINLIADIQEKVMVECDVSVIEKVLYNLLTNAINYTNKGGSITLSLKEKNQNAVIIVKDTGQGIPSSEISDIFSRTNHIKYATLNQKKGSTGIGLPLADEFLLRAE